MDIIEVIGSIIEKEREREKVSAFQWHFAHLAMILLHDEISKHDFNRSRLRQREEDAT